MLRASSPFNDVIPCNYETCCRRQCKAHETSEIELQLCKKANGEFEQKITEQAKEIQFLQMKAKALREETAALQRLQDKLEVINPSIPEI